MSDRPSNDGPTKDLSDSEIESLITGSGTPEGSEDVASVLNQIRASAKPPVAPSPEVGAFVGDRPTAPPYIDEVPLAPVEDISKRRSFIQRPAARVAMVAGITLFALTGAYAAGLLGLPGISDNGEPADVVAAEVQPAATATPEPQPAVQETAEQPLSSVDEEFGASLSYGGVSLSIAVESAGDGYIVELDIEGVSEACETAVESLSGPVSLDDLDAKSEEFETSAREIEAVCGPELEALLPSLDDPESIEQFFDGFEYELDLPEGFDGLEGFFAGELGAFGGFMQGFDAEDFEKFMEEFGLEDGDLPFDDFKPEGLDEFFDGESLKGFRLDPEEIERFFEDFNPEDLDGLLEGFGFGADDLENFFGGFQLEPGELEGLLEGFNFEELEGLLEGFNFEELDGLLEGFELDDLDGLLEDFGFDAESLEGFDSFFDDFDPEDFFEDKFDDLDEDVGSA